MFSSIVFKATKCCKLNLLIWNTKNQCRPWLHQTVSCVVSLLLSAVSFNSIPFFSTRALPMKQIMKTVCWMTNLRLLLMVLIYCFVRKRLDLFHIIVIPPWGQARGACLIPVEEPVALHFSCGRSLIKKQLKRQHPATIAEDLVSFTQFWLDYTVTASSAKQPDQKKKQLSNCWTTNLKNLTVIFAVLYPLSLLEINVAELLKQF